MMFIDTHAHLDGEEFKDDLQATVERAKEAGVSKIFIPAIDRSSITSVPSICAEYPDVLYPMMGLQPEEVKADYQEVLAIMHSLLLNDTQHRYIAVGECGLDFYWSREFEKEQLLAFEEQVKWSIELNLPLMIHCRKAQNELLEIMKPYKDKLPGGVFHCFTGNQKEAERYLDFSDRFVLGIGGVSTFKNSHLREDLPAVVPLERIVLETDSPYMAPVPNRGKRNEPAFVKQVLLTLAQAYGCTPEEMASVTNKNVQRIFGV